MPVRSLECVFIDDVDLARDETLVFVSPERNAIILNKPGADSELCICVTAQASTARPMDRLYLTLSVNSKEIDWINFTGAAVRPENYSCDVYQIDHIFAVPHHLTYRECTFVVTATTELGHLGTRELRLELPLPF
jgi:hypothetical protein